MAESVEQKKERAQKILKVLYKTYPDVECALHHDDPVQLLVATILSAQCTDKRVNMVTPALFKKYPTAKKFGQADLEELEQDIHSTGFYKNKAKAIKGCCQILAAKFGGGVPKTMEELVALPGIGRKTANVVLGVAYGTPGIVVDTHVKRLTYRMGLTKQTDPEKIEREMMEKIPPKDWTDFGLLLIAHGRAICEARKPKCPICPVNRLCPKVGLTNEKK
ncbi:MAG: endonuclease III [Deltaproteobacteria bacterium]|nr:endonuclease III [Deltaproteobacteria bacterium]